VFEALLYAHQLFNRVRDVFHSERSLDRRAFDPFTDGEGA